MESIKIENDILEMVITSMEKSEMLGALSREMLGRIAARAKLVKYDTQEIVIQEGDPSDCFYMIVTGEVAVLSKPEGNKEPVELGHMACPALIGEIGLLLDLARTATIRAAQETQLLKFDQAIFKYMFDNIPAFGHHISKFLAHRVHQLSSQVALPQHDEKAPRPPNELLKLLPMEFLIRHRVLPLRTMEKVLFMGCVDDPTPELLGAIHRQVPGRELRMIRIKSDMFNKVAQTMAGVDGWYAPSKPEKEKKAKKEAEGKSPRLDALLKRLIAEGASDLHLPAGQVPHWRIDGDIIPITDAKIVEPDEVYQLLKPIMNERLIKEFEELKDADFSYPIPGTGRFRVNIYRDDYGVSAAFRAIPSAIFTLEQLRLPPVVEEFCELSEGLVLVTGPSGSGKSTTLAAIINHINRNRRAHIITIEDPIEFLHKSDNSLVSQRELGDQVSSFGRGLRAALREDPDIVLLGEMRDLETIALALEMADTGHLVFATLHTSTAVGTVNRIIDMFPPEQQNQIRTALSDSLKGVIAQTLCKRIGGGRLAAFEVLVVNMAIGSLIREEKTIQIPSTMQTSRAQGNTFLNEDLYRLYNTKKITREEAMNKAVDKTDMEQRLGPVGPVTVGKK
jgi:twitching motility protein PilT